MWIALTCVAVAVLMPIGALAINRVPLFTAPGVKARLVYYLTNNVAQTSESGFVELRPLRTSVAPATLIEIVKELCHELGWKNVTADHAALTVSAEVRTALFRFRDDVTVWIESDNIEARVNVRSESRCGRGDLGANAARVTRLLAQVRSQIGGVK